MLKRNYSGGISKKWLNWNRFWQVLAVVYFVALFFGFRTARAFEGDQEYWTTTNENGLSAAVVSVEQGGVELAPVWSQYIYNYNTYQFGDYYFPVANSGDKLRLGVRVNGMEEGETYRIFDNQMLTSADNGTVVYYETRPHVYNYGMEDGIWCYEYNGENECSSSPLANEYVLSFSFQDENDWRNYVSRNLVVRPVNVGSANIEIVSVKQGGTDLFLDKTGRQITTLDMPVEETINEYRIDDYTTPVTLTFKLKNMEVGKRYSFNLGEDYESFRAEDNEQTFTLELPLNYAKKHINTELTFYNTDNYNDNDRVSLYFRVADANFVALGNIIISEISQRGTKINPTVGGSSYSREYTFDANDVQPVDITLSTDSATADLNYYVNYNMYGEGAYLGADEPTMVTGTELLNGTATLTLPSGYGLGDASALQLNLYVSASSSSRYNSVSVYYEAPGQGNSGSDRIYINYFEDNNLPRFDASISYTNYDGEEPGIFSEVINARYHDAEHPLMVTIHGERYDNDTVYTINGRVSTPNDDNYYSRAFTATGAELNAGKNIVMDGLVLELPEFDPTGSSSGYEMWYDFSLEIDGLEQHGSMLFGYDGWMTSMITYPGGKVAGSGANGGAGGAMYMVTNVATMRRSSITGERTATINYMGGGFDEDLEYDVALYYNGNAGDEIWSAPAGTLAASGTVTGHELNTQVSTVDMVVPVGTPDSVLYSLVISRNGGLVLVIKDFIRFTDAPMIESFAFHADSDTFMQMDNQGYRVARGTDVAATLTGAGFEDEEEYTIWVSYEGYRWVENEYGGYDTYVDLSEFDDSATVTGAELNAGYNYLLAYQQDFEDTSYVNVTFNVTDSGMSRPSRNEGMGGMSTMSTGNIYAGHSIYIVYVGEDEVFREEGGFQIDEETGEIIDVSEPGGVPVDRKTPGDVDVIVEGTGLTIVSRKPTLVIGLKDGHYELLETIQSVNNDGERTNSYDMSGYEEIKTVLKGDGTMDGVVSSADLNKITRSLVGSSLPAHRDLSELEQIILDVTGDHQVTSADTNRITRSLIGNSLPAYRALEW